jgi:molybdate transport system substrate-binding protein
MKSIMRYNVPMKRSRPDLRPAPIAAWRYSACVSLSREWFFVQGKTLCTSLAIVAIGCPLCAAQAPVRIAAAADLQPILPSLLEEYQAKTGVSVAASYASSATLATQILNGDPVDLFLSADMGFAQRVVDAGLAVESQPVPYARGTLVLWERNDGPFHPLKVDALASPSIQSVAIANPEHAPYGRAAMASLTNLKLLPKVQAKLRTAANIAQAAEYAESGNAQLGLISLNSALTDKMRSEGSFVEMPGDSYPPIIQGAVVIKKQGTNSKAAQAFLDWLLSQSAQEEMGRRGLKPPR